MIFSIFDKSSQRGVFTKVRENYSAPPANVRHVFRNIKAETPLFTALYFTPQMIIQVGPLRNLMCYVFEQKQAIRHSVLVKKPTET